MLRTTIEIFFDFWLFFVRNQFRTLTVNKIADTVSIVSPQKYMNPATSINVIITLVKTSKLATKSVNNINVTKNMQTVARIIFLSNSSVIISIVT